MKKSKLLIPILLSVCFIGVNCSNESTSLPSSTLAPSSSASELEVLIDNGIGDKSFVDGRGTANFDYSDTLYLSKYRVPEIPSPEEAMKVGTYYGTSISLPGGETVVHYYYLPPMCGDFVLLTEDGHAACYRTNAGCD